MIPAITSPKVSIIITVYNGAKYIAETIESVRNQTYQNWELIIVDDGSEDNTVEIISGIKEDRLFVQIAGRIGINGRVKNLGLSMASGELIAFLDSDDLWAPSKLEKQVAAMEQYPDAGFCVTGGYNFAQPSVPKEYFYKQKIGMTYGNVLVALFRSEVSAFLQALMLRKKCLTVAGTFKESHSFSDAHFIIELSRHFNAIVLYEPLVYRRLHEENHSTSNWERSNYDAIEIIQLYEKFLPPEVVSDAYFRLYINFGEQYLQRAKNRKAISKFFKAWRKKPLSIVPLKKTAKAVLYLLK
jgi:glycosyltransferase involved in cell wall biosynthesis